MCFGKRQAFPVGDEELFEVLFHDK
jgi:hypothetical protein